MSEPILCPICGTTRPRRTKACAVCFRTGAAPAAPVEIGVDQRYLGLPPERDEHLDVDCEPECGTCRRQEFEWALVAKAMDLRPFPTPDVLHDLTPAIAGAPDVGPVIPGRCLCGAKLVPDPAGEWCPRPGCNRYPR